MADISCDLLIFFLLPPLTHKQLGDPTAYIPPCPVIISAMTEALQSSSGMTTAGYANACGTAEARYAIHKYHYPNTTLQRDDVEEDVNDIVRTSPDDVIVANGASGGLELALTALLDEDSVLLVPRPGFPLYQGTIICYCLSCHLFY